MIHVTALESMAAELNDLGVNVTEHDLITKIICSLPVKFDFLSSSWDNIPDNEKTMDALRARLVTEQRRIMSRMTENNTPNAPSSSVNSSNANVTTNQESESKALFGFGNRGKQYNTRSNFRGFGGRRGRQQQGTSRREPYDRDSAKCTYCGKFRHYEFECRTRIANEGDKQQPAKRANNGEQGSSTQDPDYSMVSISCLKATNPEAIYLDSGASRHMTDQRSYFYELQEIEPGTWPINGIGNTVLYAHGTGTIKVSRETRGNCYHGEIKDVLFVPNLGVTLLSIASITSHGYNVNFSGMTAHVTRDEQIIMTGKRTGATLYQVDVAVQRSPTMGLAASNTQATLNTWHQRLGHVNVRTVTRMAAGIGVTGMIIKPGNGKFDTCCDGCNLGKMHKLPFTRSSTKPTVVGQLIVSDVVGPIQEPSISGARYYVLFKDVFSKYKVVYFLKAKSETEECFKSYCNKILTDTGKRVQILRSDNGGEYTGHNFEKWLAENGIKHQTCAAHTPEQNGIAERDHRSTVESARSQIHAKGAPLKLWAEAVNHSVYVLNRTLSEKANVTPYELWHGNPPDLSNLRVFGSPTYFHIPDANRQKLDPKATKGIYVGESETQKASRVYVEATGRTHITRNIRVYEDLPFWGQPESNSIPNEPTRTETEEVNPNNVAIGTKRTRPQTPPTIRKSLRGLIPRKEWNMDSAKPATTEMPFQSANGNHSLAMQALNFIFHEPKSFKEAMGSDQAQLWKMAADEEMKSHLVNNTWTLVPLPPGRECIPSGWNFKLKIDKTGVPYRRKARFFAKGYRQIQGIDYQESFAPVVRYDSLRVIIAIAAERDLELYQLDVKTAFLNGIIDEEIYIAQPEGYIKQGREREVCRLNKSIYGICQASRIWNQTLHTALVNFGFIQSTADPCVYHKIRSNCYLLAAIWVDDGLIAGNSTEFIDQTLRYLNSKFDITGSLAEHFVGIVISRDRPNKRIYLSIPQYIDKVLEKFNMSQARPTATPVLKGTPRLSKSSTTITTSEVDAMTNIPYREVVGSIMYAAITVRLDIAFIANQLAQHCQNPGMDHWKAAKRVLRYLATTRTHGICFGGGRDVKNTLVGYSDADYAGDPDTRRSTSGYVYILNGGAVTWSSRRQPIVALSTMESEYIAASDSTREAIWLRRLLDGIGVIQKEPTQLNCDNQSAILLARNPESHKGSKHIEVRFHYIREQISKNHISIKYVDTQSQLADVLTKALDIESQNKCLMGCGIGKVPEVAT
jgi:hypothetical protein